MDKSIYSKLKPIIADNLSSAAKELNYDSDDIPNTIDFSKGLGDISSSISFRLAKKQNKDVNLIANSIKDKLSKMDFVEKVSVEKGFINFQLDRKKFTRMLIDEYQKSAHASSSDIGKNIKVAFEFVSANPIHPLHVGQLRNALLGDSLSRIYVECSYDVERQNYIDDLGLQMVQAMWGYLHLEAGSENKFDHRLGMLYVEANKHMESHDIKEELSKLSQLIEQDGTYESRLAREVADSCVRAQYETLSNYKIYHNLLIWESDILLEKLLERAMQLLLKSGTIKKAEDGEYKGCIVVDLKKIKNADEFKDLKESIKVIIRSDGTPTYLAKDIAFHMWRFGLLENKFKYSKFIDKQCNGIALYTTSKDGAKMDFGDVKRAVNVIDTRQEQEQVMLKSAFKWIGKEDVSNNIIHLSYGRVELEEGTLAGRKGTWVGNTADDLLEEAIKKAKNLISSKLELSQDEQNKIAQKVALAAIKFEFLKIAPEKIMVFSWDKALNFEGNSGPYSQYMHARASRLLENSSKDLIKNIKEINEVSNPEFDLIKVLSKKEYMVEKTARELRSNVLTEYINDLSYLFAQFYEHCPVLKAKTEEERNFRMGLTLMFKNTINELLGLIGIEALERM
jgi:arginyl-tRNA synthetase